MRRMCRKLPALLLCLSLVFSALPARAAAVTPTPPAWCPADEYAVVEGSGAYLPENWEKILALRAHAQAGLGRDDPAWSETLGRYWDQLVTAASADGGDPGIFFELALIENKLWCNLDTWNADQQATATTPGNELFRQVRNTGDADVEYVVALWEARLRMLPNVRDSSLFYAIHGLLQDPRFTMEKFLDAEMFANLPRERREELGRVVSVQLDGCQVHPGPIYLGGIRTELTDVQIRDGRTMVPVRHLAEMLGADVSYDAGTGQVTMTRAGETIVMTLGDTAARVNGETVEMDIAPYAEEGRTYIPVRYMAEFFGQTVTWRLEKQLVDIWEDKSVAGDSNLEAWALAMGVDLVRGSTYSNYDCGIFGYAARGSDDGIDPDQYCVDQARGYLEKFFGVEDRETLLATAAGLLDRASDGAYPAWDLGRVACLAQLGYGAGCLTYAEALALTEPAARRVREEYSAWGPFYEEYLEGCVDYAQGGSILDGFFRRSWREEERKEYHEWLMEEPVLDESLFHSEIIPVPGLRFDAEAGDFADV